MEQKQLIKETDWDLLFIIDACRYDYFKKYYKQHFSQGKLIKAISPAAWSYGWLDAIFPDYYDFVFVSGDRIIRSKGIDPGKIRDIGKRISTKRYDASKHFAKIIDAWKYGDDNEIWHGRIEGTAHPRNVAMETTRAIKDYPNKKIIAKFWQVHDPYFLYAKETKDLKIKPIKQSNMRKLLYDVFGHETVWTVLDKFNQPPESWHMHIWQKYGRQGIINGYINDLALVLSYIKRIVEKNPDKKIVITSDHGEMLGERGKYSHGGKRTKYIKEVPWFEI